MDSRTPVLIGGGQFTQRTAREGKLAESLSPIAMLEKAARLALADAGNADALIKALDTVSVVRFTADSPGDQGRLPKRMFRNPPGSLAKHLGADPRRAIYTATGGNTPQWLVNRTAEEIANGQCAVALQSSATPCFIAPSMVAMYSAPASSATAHCPFAISSAVRFTSHCGVLPPVAV